MEFVLIINLSSSIAKDLNQRRPDHPDPNKRTGLEVKSEHCFRELNNCANFHGNIESRVFYAQDVEPDDYYVITMPGYKSVSKLVPCDKEYDTIDYNPPKVPKNSLL